MTEFLFLRSKGSLDAGHESSEEFRVICLCAEWCGVCRDYKLGFNELSAHFPEARMLWLDIEEHAEVLGDLDVENFPTLLILRRNLVLYFGVMLPHLGHLRRTLETFKEQTLEQSRDYALSSPERREWQEDLDLCFLVGTL